MKDINATVLVDLLPTEKDILEGLHKDARWGIGRAERSGLSVKTSNKKEDWAEFYKIYRKTLEEGGTNPLSLEELKKKTLQFFVCKKEGKIIAGSGIWIANKYDIKIPRLYFNASLKECQNHQPNNLLYWSCMSWCKKQGHEKFDLGGWQINARKHLTGINKFKEKWGEVIYYHKDYPIHEAVGRKLVRNFGLFHWLNQKIRKK